MSYFVARQGLFFEHGEWVAYVKGKVVAYGPDRDEVAKALEVKG